jgi:hypothetical protein
MTRLLLPFTRGLNTRAIDEAITLARLFSATLVPLALLYTHQQGQPCTVRLEEIQQAKDFLETTRYKAQRQNVRLECVELYTPDAVKTIQAFASEMECVGTMLFLRKNSGQLLATHEIKHLTQHAQLPLFLMFMPAPQSILRWPHWNLRKFLHAPQPAKQHLL